MQPNRPREHMHAICNIDRPSLKKMLIMREPKAVAINPKKTEEDVLFLLTSCWYTIIAYNSIPFKMLKRVYGEEQIFCQLSVNKCPKKGHEKTIPISSQTLVKLADNFEGKYWIHGLYAIGFIIMSKKIKKPKHNCNELIFLA